MQDTHEFGEDLKKFILSYNGKYKADSILSAITFLNASMMHDLKIPFKEFMYINEMAWESWLEVLKRMDKENDRR